MKQMTDYQRELAAQHLVLVDETIRKRIKVANEVMLTHDDYYLVGCEALCMAAMKYTHERGAFAPFACRVIYNALIDYSRNQCRHSMRRYDEPLEDDSDNYALYYLSDDDRAEDTVFSKQVLQALVSCKSRCSGITLRGIEALELKSFGYSSAEIAERYGTTINNVNAWISKARKKLRQDPEFLKCFG